ncbi:MAG: PEP-CTERM sorting domain-containing protein [Algisphaera sp.]
MPQSTLFHVAAGAALACCTTLASADLLVNDSIGSQIAISGSTSLDGVAFNSYAPSPMTSSVFGALGIPANDPTVGPTYTDYTYSYDDTTFADSSADSYASATTERHNNGVSLHSRAGYSTFLSDAPATASAQASASSTSTYTFSLDQSSDYNLTAYAFDDVSQGPWELKVELFDTLSLATPIISNTYSFYTNGATETSTLLAGDYTLQVSLSGNGISNINQLAENNVFLQSTVNFDLVPEPASLTLAMVGLGMIAGRRRRA